MTETASPEHMALLEQPVSSSAQESLSVRELIAEQVRLENELAELKTKTEATTKALNAIRDKRLPDAMFRAGMTRMLTTDGDKVEVNSVVHATWPKADNPEGRRKAVEHLESLGAADIVSTDVVISFAGSDHDTAKEFFEQVRRRNDATVTLDQTVHPKKLSAFISERLKNGRPIDLEVFGAHTFNRVSIK